MWAQRGMKKQTNWEEKEATAPLVGSEPFYCSIDMFLKGEIETLKDDV